MHRIGRTGRAGRLGTAITLFTTDSESTHTTLILRNSTNILADSKQARELVGILSEAKQNVDPRLAEMARYGGGGGGGGRGWGGGRGRGGGRGGRGGWTGSNNAPLGGERQRW